MTLQTPQSYAVPFIFFMCYLWFAVIKPPLCKLTTESDISESSIMSTHVSNSMGHTESVLMKL